MLVYNIHGWGCIRGDPDPRVVSPCSPMLRGNGVDSRTPEAGCESPNSTKGDRPYDPRFTIYHHHHHSMNESVSVLTTRQDGLNHWNCVLKHAFRLYDRISAVREVIQCWEGSSVPNTNKLGSVGSDQEIDAPVINHRH